MSSQFAMEGTNQRVSSDTFEDFHIRKFIMHRNPQAVSSFNSRMNMVSASHLKDFEAFLPSRLCKVLVFQSEAFQVFRFFVPIDINA